MSLLTLFFFFFFNDTATTEIYTLSLHDALPIAGADPNVADRAGNAPLHTAAQLGDMELVKKLLAKGTNPNVRTANAGEGGGRGAGGGGAFRLAAGAQTPLMLAARANQLDVMRA